MLARCDYNLTLGFLKVTSAVSLSKNQRDQGQNFLVKGGLRRHDDERVATACDQTGNLLIGERSARIKPMLPSPCLPNRRTAEPPNRRAAEPPSRRTDEPMNR